MILSSFTPPRILRNAHIQTSLASMGLRKTLCRFRARDLLSSSREYVLECGDGVRLLGAYSEKKGNQKGIVTLIHGWEGSIDSAYIVSAGATLFRHGYNIFRLNLRDHGRSHHLNRELFNSARLTEVLAAVKEIYRLFPHRCTFLAGFSLGGNFALRIALRAPDCGIRLTGVAAVCPLINPIEATRNLEQNYPVYHRYFVRKWQKSLYKKLQFFPDLRYKRTLLRLSSLSQMNAYFVPHHTEYRTAYEYLSAYRLKGNHLEKLAIPTHVIASNDDPITRIDDLKSLVRTPQLSIERTRYGGHCGFIEDLRLNSWVDERLAGILNEAAAQILRS
ncbi:MAG: YheT family hydrolase [Desulforhopalus sp.]